MDIFTWLAEYAELIAGAGSALCALAVLWLSAHFVRRSEFEKYKQGAKAVDDEQDRRIAAADAARAIFEQRLSGLPTSDDMHQVRITLSQISGDIKAMQVQMDGKIEALQAQMQGQQDVLNIVRHQSERINAFLMEHGGK
jgi:soluble cytochrome b562